MSAHTEYAPNIFFFLRDKRVSFIYSFTFFYFLNGSDYFTENFQVQENKTKMKNTHPRFFHFLF